MKSKQKPHCYRIVTSPINLMLTLAILYPTKSKRCLIQTKISIHISQVNKVHMSFSPLSFQLVDQHFAGQNIFCEGAFHNTKHIIKLISKHYGLCGLVMAFWVFIKPIHKWIPSNNRPVR